MPPGVCSHRRRPRNARRLRACTIGRTGESGGRRTGLRADVKPLLTRKCYACHGALKQSGGLRLDTRGVMLTGGDSGAAVVPHSAEKSLLLSAVRGDGDIERMPLESEALDPAEIAILERWVGAGLRAPTSRCLPIRVSTGRSNHSCGRKFRRRKTRPQRIPRRPCIRSMRCWPLNKRSEE